MSDELRTCPGYACGASLRDGFLCRSCQRRAERVLGDLPALARDADVTAARLDRVASAGARSHADGGEVSETKPGSFSLSEPTPLPMRVNRDGKTISDVTDNVLSLLYEWSDHVAQWFDGEQPLPLSVRGDRRPPRHLMVPMATSLLLRHSGWMRWNEEGPELAHAVWTVRRDLRAIVDRPPERTFAGPCQARVLVAGADHDEDEDSLVFDAWESRCKVALYRRWGQDTIVCDGYNDPDGRKGCGAQHLAAERDEWLVAAVEEELLPLRVVWESLYVLIPGCSVDWETARKWPRRVGSTPARLLPRMSIEGREPLFRGGDILALARDSVPRRGRRRRRRVTRHTERTAS